MGLPCGMGAGAEISVSEATEFQAWIDSNTDVIDLYPGKTEDGDARQRSEQRDDLQVSADPPQRYPRELGQRSSEIADTALIRPAVPGIVHRRDFLF